MKKEMIKINKPSHIVGIGASAGGLEALQTLFENMPVDLGIAYVVIQHLSSDFKSMMDELLRRHTTMAVKQAEEEEELLSDHVYLIPSGKLMRIVEGKIYLSDLPPDNRINMPINEFFKSLAEDQQNRAIGVILSGTGSDGLRGLQVLKEVGALLIAQDPAEAQFDGMPLSAISTGCVDVILTTKEIPIQIKKFVLHPLNSNARNDFRVHLSENEELLGDILKLIQSQTDLDFKAYKESTISRRIKHRMGINNIQTLQEYHTYVMAHEEEIELMKQDFLIGVTQFFRDVEVWKEMRSSVIKQIVEEGNEETPIRIWSSGCSTGEEPYTIAILFAEVMEELKIHKHVKIFASDIDEPALTYAGIGIYPSSIDTEIDEKLLHKYFNKLSDGSYQICKEIRSMVVFATHNLIQDPPFSNMDLVSCRNTLIYLQNAAQRKAMGFFHFALKQNGRLLLGTAETPGNLITFFEVLNGRLKIYRKSKNVRIPLSSLGDIGMNHQSHGAKLISQFLARNIKLDTKKMSSLKIGYANLFEVFIPPTILVNKKLEVIYSYGDTDYFTLKLKPGHVTNNLADIINPLFVSHCISAVHQAIREKKKLLYKNVYTDKELNVIWSIKCFRFMDDDSNEEIISLSFLKNDSEFVYDADVNYNISEQAEKRIFDLDKALIECQNLYKDSLEQLDTTSEELQSSNEELMAANEELQSTNEELQSVNEELYTVNSEFQEKISELINTNNDLENLLISTKLAVLFLDHDLKIRRYTKECNKFVNIIDFDIDRDFRDLSLKANFDDLHKLIEKVNNTGKDVTKIYTLSETKQVEAVISSYHLNNTNHGVIVTMREI